MHQANEAADETRHPSTVAGATAVVRAGPPVTPSGHEQLAAYQTAQITPDQSRGWRARPRAPAPAARTATGRPVSPVTDILRAARTCRRRRLRRDRPSASTATVAGVMSLWSPAGRRCAPQRRGQPSTRPPADLSLGVQSGLLAGQPGHVLTAAPHAPRRQAEFMARQYVPILISSAV